MLTVSEADRDVLAALRAGAIGYVLKGVSAAELVDILEGVARGEAHVSPGLAALAGLPEARPRGAAPADRRAQPARGGHPAPVARGLSNREVAEDLAIQEKTVKHYMTSILEKLQARNRVEAALIAREAWGEEKG